MWQGTDLVVQSQKDMHNLHRRYAKLHYPNQHNYAIRGATPKRQEQ
jgi:hypothetical protein